MVSKRRESLIQTEENTFVISKSFTANLTKIVAIETQGSWLSHGQTFQAVFPYEAEGKMSQLVSTEYQR